MRQTASSLHAPATTIFFTTAQNYWSQGLRTETFEIVSQNIPFLPWVIYVRYFVTEMEV
jgi:hypothetical protein